MRHNIGHRVEVVNTNSSYHAEEGVVVEISGHSQKDLDDSGVVYRVKLDCCNRAMMFLGKELERL